MGQQEAIEELLLRELGPRIEPWEASEIAEHIVEDVIVPFQRDGFVTLDEPGPTTL